MFSKAATSLLLLLLLAAAVSARSVAPAPEVERMDTLDGARVYQLTIHLTQPLPPGAAIEYLILSADGVVAGGGQFSVRPDMMTPEGNAVSVLSGFGGLDMSLGYRIVADVIDVIKASPERSPRSLTGAQITDTCTTFCDRCADKAASLCTNGVATYNCSCSGESRNCNYTCLAGGKPPV